MHGLGNDFVVLDARETALPAITELIGRRIAALGMDGLEDYRARLTGDEAEWRVLDRMCRVTISRLWRDRETIASLGTTVLPALATTAAASGAMCVDVWSCGCASGEEPFTVSILWHDRVARRFPDLGLRILATDVDLHLLHRARRAVYPVGATRDVPAEVAAAALEPMGGGGGEVRVKDRDRAGVYPVQSDVRDGVPGGPFHLILCRNLVFTYFDETLQREVGSRMVEDLHPGGALVLGGHETLPDGFGGVGPWPRLDCVFKRMD